MENNTAPNTIRFEIPAELLGTYRNMTIDEPVTDLDPDGFSSTREVGDRIIREIRARAAANDAENE